MLANTETHDRVYLSDRLIFRTSGPARPIDDGVLGTSAQTETDVSRWVKTGCGAGVPQVTHDYTDLMGKRHQEVVRDDKGNSTRELAEEKLETILGEKRQGLVTARQRRTFKQLGKQYLTDIISNISAHTFQEYKGIIERRLAPTLDVYRVDQIGVPTVRALKAKLLADGFAAATINKTLILLGMILSTAVADRELSFNPCDHVRKMPSRASSVDADSGEITERHALTREQVAALLRASAELAELAAQRPSTLKIKAARVRYAHSQNCYHALFVTAARTGLRASELLALRWEDVNTEFGELSVRRRYRNASFDAPKSRTSARRVPITSDALAILRTWRMRSPHKSPQSLVFCSARGRPLSASNVGRRGVHPAAKLASLTGVGLHVLRHTFGSQLLAAGEDLATVSKLMGHASVSVTANVYLHAIQKPLGESASKLELYLAGK
jgi:integrase